MSSTPLFWAVLPVALVVLVLASATLVTEKYAGGADIMLWIAEGTAASVAGAAGCLLAHWCGKLRAADARTARLHGELAQAARLQKEREDESARLHEESAGLREDLERARNGVRWASARLIPQVLQRLEQHRSAQTIMEQLAQEGALPHDQATRELVERVVAVVFRERRERDGAVAVARSYGYRISAAVTSLLGFAAERQAVYQGIRDEVVPLRVVLEDWSALDAGLSALGRPTQNLLALSGARNIGRRWDGPVELERVLRAAFGQNAGYRRVEWAGIPSKAVQPRAVNAIVHIVSELVANALGFSTPHSPVEVSTVDLDAGVSIRVEDSGVGLSPEALQRVLRTVDLDREPLSYAELADGLLGLAGARKTAESFGMWIAFGTSRRLGGTEASVLIPWDCLTTARAASQPPAPPAGKQLVPAAAQHTHPALPPPQSSPGTKPDAPTPPSGSRRELPVRTRKATPARQPQAASGAETPLRPDTGHRMDGWRAGVRPAPSPDTPENSA
ncbi:ATP-binding protein [Streptomyces chrestomyceticus]|uniref:ATP-binding protein n=1 Tax=Streptomyces chrestomyceticus TaxID=68185 RepID=UPI00368CEC9E